MNKTVKVILPVIIAISVSTGIVLGIKINQRLKSQSNHPANIFQPDKISLLLRLIERDYVDSINSKKIAEDIIPDILKELDPHSSYIPAKNMQAVSEDFRGNFSGIGVQFVMQKDTVLITDVIAGGPSEKVGIIAGDRIVRVNGDTISGIEMSQDSIVSILRGKKGTLVNVSIHRPGFADLFEFEIERGEIPLYSIDVAYMIDDKTGFIKVNRFAESTFREFVLALQTIIDYKAENLIIDLRGNSGGSLSAVISMVDQFLPAGQLIVYTEGKSRMRHDYRSSKDGLWVDKEVAVLIDEFSASASEIFAGAIQDNDRGLIVGRRSFGKGLVQEQFPFFDGSALRLTVARFHTPSGRCIQKSYEEGVDAYNMNFHDRLMNGAQFHRDTTGLADSLRYYTIGGKPVYGGGGIRPDYFVPADTSGMNQFYTAVASKNYIYRYAFDYADKNRAELKTWDNYKSLNQHLKNIEIYADFVAFVKAKGINSDQQQIKEAQTLIETQLLAVVSRNIFGDEGFFPTLFEMDPTVKKALELLEKD